MPRAAGGSTVRANPSTAQTNTALVAAVNNKRVELESIYISSDTELTVTLVNSVTHDVLWRQYVGARGGSRLPLDFESAQNEGVDYTTSGNGNVFILLNYRYKGKG